jgi:hypothetical protein
MACTKTALPTHTTYTSGKEKMPNNCSVMGLYFWLGAEYDWKLILEGRATHMTGVLKCGYIILKL